MNSPLHAGAAELAREADRFLRLAGPMIVSRLGLAGLAITDGWMVAHHSPNELAALGLADGTLGRLLEVLAALVLAGLALAAPGTPGVPPAEPEGSRGGSDAARRRGTVWHQAMLLGTLAGVGAALLGGFAQVLFTALGQPTALAERGGLVAFVLGLGFPLALIGLATGGFLEAIGRATLVAVVVVLANGVNILLNSVLVFGLGGLPALGAVGSAWSTTTVRLLVAIGLVACTWNLRDQVELGVRRRVDRAAGEAGREQRQRGCSAAATVLLLVSLNMSIPVFAGRLGAAALAQTTAFFLCLAPCGVMVWGLADAAALRVAASCAELGPRQLRGVVGVAVVTALSMVLLAVSPYLFAPRFIAGLAAGDPDLATPLAALLGIGAVLLLIDTLSFVLGASLRSLGELKWPFIAHLAAAALVPPMAWWLAFEQRLGVLGLITALLISSTMRAVFLASLFLRRTRAAAPLALPSVPGATPISF
jgi:MATE family multidrug resistance protein